MRVDCRLKAEGRRTLSRDRRGISLTEVLISMFVLLIGLLGVAAMIPAGRHEILEGAKIDNATAVGRAAFRDLKIRGYLNPANWRLSDGSSPVFQPSPPLFNSSNTFGQGTNGVTPAVAIDPLALPPPPAINYGPKFPSSAGADLFLTRIFPDNRSGASLPQLALVNDIVFRAQDDVIFTPSAAGQDNPPEQNIYTSANGVQPYSKGSSPLKRASEGNYSWLATIVSHPAAPPSNGALGGQVTVSVAVFYKRDLSDPATTERIGTVAAFIPFPGGGIGGGEIRVQHATPPPGTKVKPLKPGNWVMLAGGLYLASPRRDYYRWYRVVAADTVPIPGYTQEVTLAGADWDTETWGGTPETEVWMFDNIVTVYEKNMRLEVE